MKAKITFIILIISCYIGFSQTPNAFKYQAVVRNNAGAAIEDQNVSFRISLLQNTTQVFQETHDVTTNAYGLVNLNIGMGTIISGSISSIDWNLGDYYMEIEIDQDTSDGISYTNMGTVQLLSVPFALHAKTVESIDDEEHWTWSDSGNFLYHNLGNVKIGGASPAQNRLDVTGNINTSEAYKIDNSTILRNNGSSIYLGILSGSNNTGSHNVFLGDRTGFNSTSSQNNVFIGRQSGLNNGTGSNNVAIGYQSGYRANSGNVFIGYRSGFFETGSNKLYIDNSDTNTPLIGGDFSSNSLTLNGQVSANGFFQINGDFSIEDSGTTNDIFQVYDVGADGVAEVRANGSTTLRLHSDGSSYFNGGNVGIGTSSPSQKLHVNGNILATGTITPDYVFEKYYSGMSNLNPDYKMLSLDEIEVFTKKYNHLPGVPSSNEIEAEGGILINRATEINLEKIEELFLHLIELKKENELLKERLRMLEIKCGN